MADRLNHRIQKFDSSGTFLTQWGTNGTGNRQLDRSHGVAIDAAGDAYVTDTFNNRVRKFTCP